MRDIPAVAQNISRAGLLVRGGSSALWGVTGTGQRLEINVEISSEDRSRSRVLECVGTVAWSREHDGGGVLLGLSISRMQFRNAPSDTPRGLWNANGEIVM